MPACSSCGSGIAWASMRGTGAHMPCDLPAIEADEVAAGTVALRGRDRLGVVLSAEQAMRVRSRADRAAWAEWTFHTSHWDSCASASKHRVNPDQEALEL